MENFIAAIETADRSQASAELTNSTGRGTLPLPEAHSLAARYPSPLFSAKSAI